jgi:hypothetical protein
LGSTQGGSDATGECPTGYPYCPTIDACLLPGRVCPADDDDNSGGTAPIDDPAPGISGSGGVGGSISSGGQPTTGELSQEPTPGMIRCGDSLCDSYTQYCCSGLGGSGSGSGFETCSDSFCSARRECDETSDCVGTEVCCFSVISSPPPILAATCQQPEQCGYDGSYIGCGSQADCDAAGAPDCVAQPCGGATIQTCGPITRSFCK